MIDTGIYNDVDTMIDTRVGTDVDTKIDTESRKKSSLPPTVTSLCMTFLTIQHRREFPILSLCFPHTKSLDLQASEFSSNDFFCTLTEPSSKLEQL